MKSITIISFQEHPYSLKKMLEWADVVFINGEGNIVHGTDANGKYRMGGSLHFVYGMVGKSKI